MRSWSYKYLNKFVIQDKTCVTLRLDYVLKIKDIILDLNTIKDIYVIIQIEENLHFDLL